MAGAVCSPGLVDGSTAIKIDTNLIVAINPSYDTVASAKQIVLSSEAGLNTESGNWCLETYNTQPVTRNP